jgi:hypothetical protein
MLNTLLHNIKGMAGWTGNFLEFGCCTKLDDLRQDENSPLSDFDVFKPSGPKKMKRKKAELNNRNTLNCMLTKHAVRNSLECT